MEAVANFFGGGRPTFCQQRLRWRDFFEKIEGEEYCKQIPRCSLESSIYIYIYVCMYVYIYIYVCMYTCTQK